MSLFNLNRQDDKMNGVVLTVDRAGAEHLLLAAASLR
jgi:hypothetical protein